MTTAPTTGPRTAKKEAIARPSLPGKIPAGLLLRAALIVLVALWIYAPQLRGGWIWDDTLLVTDNKLIHDPAGLWKIWFQPSSLFDYQPLKFSVVWLQWHLWGNNPLPYHVTNLLLHIASSLLVWRLLAKLRLKLAWLGGLIFALHPLQVESVAWISELKNTLSLPPFLLAMCAWLDFDQRGRRRDYFLSLALFAAAMLCKTTMMMWPVVLLLHAWWKRGRVTWPDAARSAPFFALSLALGLVTIWAQQHQGDDSLLAPAHGFLTRFVLAGQVLSFAVAKFVWPMLLSPIYPLWPIDPASPFAYLPWLALAAWLVGCWTQRASRGRDALLPTGFFLLNLLPPVAFLVARYPNVAWSLDHLLYLPIIGLIGLVVAGLDQVDTKITGPVRLAWVLPMTSALCLLALQSRAYVSVFNDAKTLWTYTLRQDPASIVAHMNLGQLLSNEGRAPEAADHFRRVLQVVPNYAEAHDNLAHELVMLGKNEQAIHEYEQAVTLKPALAHAHINLGLLLMAMGRNDEALPHLQQAVQLEPDAPKPHLALGDSFRQAGRLDDAVYEYEQVARLQPNLAEPHRALAWIYLQQGRVGDLQRECAAALQLDPQDADAYFIRGVLELSAAANAAADADFTRAIQLNPHQADAHFRRGTLREIRGDLTTSLYDYEEGCRLAPKDALADYARLSIWVVKSQLGQKTEADHELATALAQSWNAPAAAWVTELARFLLGQAKEAEVMAMAATDAAKPGSGPLTCEAWYFSGMKALASGQKVKALDDLQQCVATGQNNSIKYRLASAELQSLASP